MHEIERLAQEEGITMAEASLSAASSSNFTKLKLGETKADLSFEACTSDGHLIEMFDEVMGNPSEAQAKKEQTMIHHRMWFNIIIAIVVVLNAIQLGVELDYPEHGFFYWVMDHTFTAIFTAEMVIKLIELRSAYFREGWNQLDFLLVMMSIVDSWVLPVAVGDGADMRMYSVLRVLRALRVIRAVRVLRVFKELWKIVRGIIDSFKTIVWAVLVLVLVLYVCGIFCCTMIGKNTSAGYYDSSDPNAGEMEDGEFDKNQYYGTVPRAMFTLFETSIEPLNIRPVIERQPELIIFFLAFIFLTTFGVMNVIVGVIVDQTMSIGQEAQHAEEIDEFKNKIAKLDKISRLCIDADGSGTVCPEELKEAMEDSKVQDILDDLQLPMGMHPDEFFYLVDTKGTGTITSAEMMMQLTRTVVHGDHQKLMELKIQANATRKAVNQVSANMADFQKEMREGLRELKDQIQCRFGKCFVKEGSNNPEFPPSTPPPKTFSDDAKTSVSPGRPFQDDSKTGTPKCESEAGRVQKAMKKTLDENPDCPEVTGPMMQEGPLLPANRSQVSVPILDNQSMRPRCEADAVASTADSSSTQLPTEALINSGTSNLQPLAPQGKSESSGPLAASSEVHPPSLPIASKDDEQSWDASKSHQGQHVQLPSVPMEPPSSKDGDRCSPAMPPRMSSATSSFIAHDDSGRSSLAWKGPSFPRTPKAPGFAMSARGGSDEEDGVPSMRDWKL